MHTSVVAKLAPVAVSALAAVWMISQPAPQAGRREAASAINPAAAQIWVDAHCRGSTPARVAGRVMHTDDLLTADALLNERSRDAGPDVACAEAHRLIAQAAGPRAATVEIVAWLVAD